MNEFTITVATFAIQKTYQIEKLYISDDKDPTLYDIKWSKQSLFKKF